MASLVMAGSGMGTCCSVLWSEAVHITTHREREREDVSHDGCHGGGYDIIGAIAAAHTLAASVTAVDCMLSLECCSGDMVLDSWTVACTITDAIGGGSGHEQPSPRQSDDDTAQAGQALGFWCCSCTNATTSTR
jgi:hypothetical protein